MKNRVLWVSSLCVFALVSLFSLSVEAGKESEGQSLKEKISSKIEAAKNIQYNLDVVQQYEPYYQASNLGSEQWGQQAEGINEQTAVVGAVIHKRSEALRKKDKGNVLSCEKPLSVSNSVIADDNEAGDFMPVLSSYAIYRAKYAAEIEESVVTVKGEVLFEVFQKGWTKLPLVSSRVGLIDVSVNRSTSFVTMERGKYYLMIDRPGRYTLDIEFLIKAKREREGGPGSFSFEVLPAPISQFEFIMPETGVEIFVDPAIKVEVEKHAKSTTAWAVMPNTNNITTRWTKALPKDDIAPVELEPKVYMDAATYASVGEGLIRCETKLNYSILQSEVSNLRVAFPEDVSVLEVKGHNLRDWKVSKDKTKNAQYLDVYLNYGVKGNYYLTLTYERKIGEGSVVAAIPSLRGIGVEREKGYYGLAAATNVELAISRVEHVSRIDVKELPSSIWQRTANPILLAFKYLKHPYQIEIEVTKHEELPVLVAAIDQAQGLTLQMEEGKVLTTATYQVRNNVKQFIRFTLPDGAKLWSAFVAGKPVKPARDKEGKILIPLEKSKLQGEDLTQFPVEIVYLGKAPKMSFLGQVKLDLPRVDIPVSELQWNIYVPKEYRYFAFGGNVKQTKGGLFSSRSGGFMKTRETRKYEKTLSQMTQQAQVMDTYEEVAQTDGSGVKGVLPIKIGFPKQDRGRLIRFHKLLVTEDETPEVTMKYIFAPKYVSHISILIILIGLVVFLISRTRNRSVSV